MFAVLAAVLFCAVAPSFAAASAPSDRGSGRGSIVAHFAHITCDPYIDYPYLYRVLPNGHAQELFLSHKNPDKNGYLRLNGLKPGRYAVKNVCLDEETYRRVQFWSQSVRVRAGHVTKTKVIRPVSGTGTITVRFNDGYDFATLELPDGGLARPWLYDAANWTCRTDAGHVVTMCNGSGLVTSQPDGSYIATISGIVPGTYRVTLSKDLTVLHTTQVQVASGSTTNLNWQ